MTEDSGKERKKQKLNLNKRQDELEARVTQGIKTLVLLTTTLCRRCDSVSYRHVDALFLENISKAGALSDYKHN